MATVYGTIGPPIVTISSTLDSVKDNLAEINGTIDLVRESDLRTEKHIDELEADMEYFNDVLHDVTRDMIDLKASADELDTSVNTLGSKVEYLMEYIKRQEAAIKVLESTVHLLTRQAMNK